jgi:putative protease
MKTELLAPAGNLEKLKWACAYGADAVYFGSEFGSLRNYAGNFSFDDAKEGLDHLHSRGKKGYVALNIYPFSDEYKKLTETAKTLDEMGADAFIVADLGVLTELKKAGIKAALHISTQANTTSWQTVLAYKELGASRVNLARELSLEQIKEMQKHTAGQIETEVFIHGAVCFSYSGRCAISDYMTGFRANRGECKHPCCGLYSLVEEKRPGKPYPVFEDERGLYFFNNKDLALWPFVGELAANGVTSFKIEGRMKAIHYIASTVAFYRQVLDGKVFTEEEGMKILGRIPNRGYSYGFMNGGISADDYSMGQSLSQAESVFVGNVLGEKIDGKSVVEVRNKIIAGNDLEILRPNGTLGEITMSSPLIDKWGRSQEVVNNSQFVLVDEDLPEYSVLRKVDQGQ